MSLHPTPASEYMLSDHCCRSPLFTSGCARTQLCPSVGDSCANGGVFDAKFSLVRFLLRHQEALAALQFFGGRQPPHPGRVSTALSHITVDEHVMAYSPTAGNLCGQSLVPPWHSRSRRCGCGVASLRGCTSLLVMVSLFWLNFKLVSLWQQDLKADLQVQQQ